MRPAPARSASDRAISATVSALRTWLPRRPPVVRVADCRPIGKAGACRLERRQAAEEHTGQERGGQREEQHRQAHFGVDVAHGLRRECGERWQRPDDDQHARAPPSVDSTTLSVIS